MSTFVALVAKLFRAHHAPTVPPVAELPPAPVVVPVRTRKPRRPADRRPAACCYLVVAHTQDGRPYLHRCRPVPPVLPVGEGEEDS